MDPEGHFIDAFGRSFPKVCALGFMEALTDAGRTFAGRRFSKDPKLYRGMERRQEMGYCYRSYSVMPETGSALQNTETVADDDGDFLCFCRIMQAQA